MIFRVECRLNNEAKSNTRMGEKKKNKKVTRAREHANVNHTVLNHDAFFKTLYV